jgi:hypothetical protein
MLPVPLQDMQTANAIEQWALLTKHALVIRAASSFCRWDGLWEGAAAERLLLLLLLLLVPAASP